jgi:hypothetical protein
MYSGLDRRVHFSEEELAMGAVDLAEIEKEESVNSTMALIANSTMQAAVSVVKEAGPKIIETIMKQLVPVFPASSQPTVSPFSHQSTVFPSSFQSPPGTQQTSVIPILPEVLVSPPLETVVIIPLPHNNTSSIHPSVYVHDTVKIPIIYPPKFNNIFWIII